MQIFTFANALTLARLILSPLMLPLLLVYFLPYNSLIINIVLTILFILLSLTDFFDGYFARRFRQVTSIGKQLDPIADKFLSYSTLIALLTVQKIFFYWVIILVGRDFFVMGLRAIAQDNGLKVPVSFLSKIRTMAMMAFMAFSILNPYQSKGVAHTWNLIEMALLGAVLLLSILSAKAYYDQFMTEMVAAGKTVDSIEPELHEKPEQNEWDEDKL